MWTLYQGIIQMARTSTRHFVRRDMRQAQARLDKIEDYLARCGSLYHDDHPELYDAFCACIQLTQMLKNALVTLNESI